MKTDDGRRAIVFLYLPPFVPLWANYLVLYHFLQVVVYLMNGEIYIVSCELNAVCRVYEATKERNRT